MKRILKYKERNTLGLFPVFVYVFAALLVLSIAVYLIAVISPEFADFWSRYPGAFVRALLAHLTSLFPFSLAEIAIILLPAALIVFIVLAVRGKLDFIKSPLRFTVSLIACTSMFFSLFALGFGTGYHGSTLDKKMGIEKGKISKEELAETAAYLADKVNDEARNVYFETDSFSVMPYSLSELNRRLLDAYKNVCDEYDFIQRLSSRVKPVILSEPMSYTHITGVYTYFTGEANLNVNFPDYTLPFTAAHELAHQRGIAREDEANFVAFLVCSASDDPYIRYSGYLNLYEHIASPLSAYKELYAPISQSLDPKVIGELIAYSEFFDKYRHSAVGEVSESINNSYLQSVGTAGTKSYGMVVDLAVAYLKDEINE